MPSANGALNIVDAKITRIDWLASAAGPSSDAASVSTSHAHNLSPIWPTPHIPKWTRIPSLENMRRDGGVQAVRGEKKRACRMNRNDIRVKENTVAIGAPMNPSCRKSRSRSHFDGRRGGPKTNGGINKLVIGENKE
jgi:hypothetical protein